MGVFSHSIVYKRKNSTKLLATHENGRGPVDWRDESQREREGLDVCGAELCQADLSNTPLARLCGGMPRDAWNAFVEERSMYAVTKAQRVTIVMLMAHADLIGAHMEGVHFCDVHLEGAYLIETHLEGADLAFAHLKDADLVWVHLEGADLIAARASTVMPNFHN